MYTRNLYNPKIDNLIEMWKEINNLKKNLWWKLKNQITIDRKNGNIQNWWSRVNFHIDHFEWRLSEALKIADEKINKLEERTSRYTQKNNFSPSTDSIWEKLIPKKLLVEYLSLEKLLGILTEKIESIPSWGFWISSRKKNRKK